MSWIIKSSYNQGNRVKDSRFFKYQMSIFVCRSTKSYHEYN